MQKKTLKEIIKEEYKRCVQDPVHFMRKYCIIQHPTQGKIYFNFRETLKLIISAFSKRFSNKAGKAEDFLRSMVTGGTLFSSLGFYYIGPIDGHDIKNMITFLFQVI